MDDKVIEVIKTKRRNSCRFFHMLPAHFLSSRGY